MKKILISLLQKISTLFRDFATKIRTSQTAKKAIKTSALVLLGLLAALAILWGAIKLISYILLRIGLFLEIHFGAFMLILIAVVSGIVITHKSRIKRDEAAAKVTRAQQVKAEAIRREIAEFGYQATGEVIFQILSDVASIVSIKKPNTLDEIAAPVKIVTDSGVLFYQFIAFKNGNDVDIAIMRELLQKRLWQILLQNPTSAFLNSQKTRPALSIHEITDSGAYLQISVAVVDDGYSSYREAKDIAKQRILNPTLLNFVDEDFTWLSICFLTAKPLTMG